MVLVPTVGVQSMTKGELQSRLAELDKTLSGVPFVLALEKQSGIAKVHLAGIATFGAILFVLIFNNLYAGLLTDVCGYFYPAYMSLKSVGKGPREQGQWLGYWTVFVFLHLIEYAQDALLNIFPYYYTFKLVLVLWLISPSAKGALFIYDLILKPLVPLVDVLVAIETKKETVVVAPAAVAAAPAATTAVLVEATPVVPGAVVDKSVEKDAKKQTGKIKWGYVKLR
ncbi:hypothetical protein PhCBS80983_g06396 [Powellomyces hirtus]|uniref:Protein YOP1 n=1 Tax=Powellomyces hirtus TaxID=109895 RepID=A0A507DP18_9FUNG|nr:TB2/DP1, HVA22 family-domain-containing protein [Powellomyces hirtus]TPX52937.1 hypothetical protein PhCBS80983_g06396 [Powellomyces hirtus]